MSDLLDFLRARLDEDERVARAAHQPNWRWYTEDKGVVTKQDDAGDYERWSPTYTRSDAEHIAHHDPARVLAEVEAKRRILDEHERALERRKRHPDDLASAGALLTMLHVVKMLALPYSDHPAYRPEWRP